MIPFLESEIMDRRLFKRICDKGAGGVNEDLFRWKEYAISCRYL